MVLGNVDTLLPTQMFPRLPVRATFVADTNFVSATNVSQFAQLKKHLKHHEQQCVHVCQYLNTLLSFTTKFPVAACLKTENDKNLFTKISNSCGSERLGVPYFLLNPLQMILYLYMYKQFFMSTVDF